MNTYHLQINGSTNARQVHRLESRLRLLAGVTDASAATDTGHVTVRGREGLMPLITRTLKDAGSELASNHTTRRTTVARWYQHGWLTEPTHAA
jgi:cation transport ATPase